METGTTRGLCHTQQIQKQSKSFCSMNFIKKIQFLPDETVVEVKVSRKVKWTNETKLSTPV